VLAELHGIEMPIASGVRRILEGDLDPKAAVEEILGRQLRAENE
jgi:glycerol-3-phosphate dehydrogenase